MQKSVLISYGSETINYGLKNQNLFLSAFQKYKCSTIQIVEFPKKQMVICVYIKTRPALAHVVLKYISKISKCQFLIVQMLIKNTQN